MAAGKAFRGRTEAGSDLSADSVTTYLDTETRSAVPITHGTDRYTANAECLLLTFARDDGQSQLWDVIGGQRQPKDFQDALDDPTEEFIAHNAAFDRAILHRCLGFETSISRWRCTMAQAYAHGLPGGLGALGAVLGLAEEDQKRIDDSKLIHLFCVPRSDGSWATRETHPTEWARFCGYALNDTIALREVHRRLPSHNFQGINLESWRLDQLINGRGFGFDRTLAVAARQVLAKAKGAHDADITRATQGTVTAATQRDKLLKYLRVAGLDLPDMRASTMREWLESDTLRPEHRFILELRLEAAKSSGSKYRRGLETVGEGDRIRYAIQFSGAGRTGRSSGRGFQPHNMPRPTMKAKYIEEVVIPGILASADP
jgi:DNA polymerase bacteriophage-type